MSAPVQLLIIEDNETDAFLETRELQRAGLILAPTRVDTEEDLRSALARQAWDLLLCDFTLPGFSGSEALRIAKELAPETPFIFVSGTIGEAAIVDAMRSGAQDYVMKDRLTRLAPAVRRELREAALRREARVNERWMRETEHKYRHLFDALTEAVFVIDETSGRVIDTNRQAEQLLRRERRAIVGQNHAQLLATPSGDLVLAELRSASAHPEQGGCVLLLLRPADAPLAVHASASPIELYGRSLLLVLTHTRLGRAAGSGSSRLTTEEIVTEVAQWPQEETDELLTRLARLHHGEDSTLGRR